MTSPRLCLMIVHMTAFKLGEEGQARFILTIAPVGPGPVEEAMGIVPVGSHIILAKNLAVRPVVAIDLIGAGQDLIRIGLEEAMVRMTVLIMTAVQSVGRRIGESNVDGAILGAAQRG